MDIFVASDNGHKVASMRKTALEVFPKAAPSVRGKKAETGFGEEIRGRNRIKLAAMKRMEVLKELIAGTRYDLLVAMQNGIYREKLDGEKAWFDMAWVLVEDADGNRSFAPSMGVQFNTSDVEATEQKEGGFTTNIVGQTTADRVLLEEGVIVDPTDPQFYETSELLKRLEILQQTSKGAIGQLLKKSPKLRAFRDLK